MSRRFMQGLLLGAALSLTAFASYLRQPVWLIVIALCVFAAAVLEIE